jgi:protein gp37
MRQSHPNPKISARNAGLTTAGRFNGTIRFNHDLLELPHKTTKPTTWAIWTDLFHRGVQTFDIEQAFAVMRDNPRHTFLVLTKRPVRMSRTVRNPLPNVMLGCTAENQAYAARRRSPMAAIAAMGWKTWVSSEPRLSAINWTGWEFLDWMVSGCESGPRPAELDWFRADRDWCRENDVPWWLKQIKVGGKMVKGPELDGERHLCPGLPANKTLAQADAAGLGG